MSSDRRSPYTEEYVPRTDSAATVVVRRDVLADTGNSAADGTIAGSGATLPAVGFMAVIAGRRQRP